MKWSGASAIRGLLAGALLGGLLATAGAQEQAQSVALKAREFAFDPREVTVRAGDVTIVVTNEGGIEHALIVEDDSRTTLAEIPSVLPDKSEQVRVTLSPGSYTFYCPVGSGFHRRRGMVGQLKVTE
jgi:plastocyanin